MGRYEGEMKASYLFIHARNQALSAGRRPRKCPKRANLDFAERPRLQNKRLTLQAGGGVHEGTERNHWKPWN